VFHVHFHIIPKIAGKGLGIGWAPGKLGSDEAARLLASMHASLGV
jgi:diadenosine tetraphosphate (Ap4A) HIT family hydrolase